MRLFKEWLIRSYYLLTGFTYLFKAPVSRVLVYHVLDDRSVHLFEENIIYLLRKGYRFVTAREFGRLLTVKSLTANMRICAITFDDGSKSVYTKALPILKKYRIPATVFINLDLHRLHDNPKGTELMAEKIFPRLYKRHKDLIGLSKQEIVDLIDNGIEIGGHTITHPDLGRTTNYFLELAGPVQFFSSAFNYHIKTFAYPYGRKHNYTDEVIQELRDCGYEYAFLGISADPQYSLWDKPYELPRTSVPDGFRGGKFHSLLAGSQDLLDRLLNQER